MNIRKILASLSIHSNASTPPRKSHTVGGVSSPGVGQSSRQILVGQQGQTAEPDEDDLLAFHMAQRSARMFAAEEAEARQGLHTIALEGPQEAPSPTALRQEPQYRAPYNRDGRRRSRRQHRAQRQDPLDRLRRVDRSVRASALATISATMLDISIDGRAAAVTLRKTMEECRTAGVPFEELLEEEIEGFGMVPLVFQVIRCNWNNDAADRDLLLFLLEHSPSRRLGWNIRQG